MTTALDYLEKTANRVGDKTVVREPSGELSYSGLVTKARNIGYNLSMILSGKRNVPVVVFIDKGCDCLASIFGVLYSGNCYVPIDVKTPRDRLGLILETLKSDIVIVNEKSRPLMEKLQIECSVLLYEDLALSPDNEEDRECALEMIRSSIIDTDLMYILFTSGSTGVPKGVAVMHRSVVDYIRAFVKTVPIDSSDIIGNQTPFFVDMSLKDIYMSIAAGATIVIIPQTYFMSPKKLLTYLDDNEVTMLMWVPTAYSIVTRFDGLSRIRPKSLRKFLFSGESMPISVFSGWFSQYPDALWVQLYGPTEITGACTYFRVDRSYEEGEVIPIGKPFPNTGIVLLDENDEEIEQSVTDKAGEICVFGSCLAAGYYNDPVKTASSFVQNPLVTTHPALMYRTGDLAKWDEQGNLVFISRKDYQIKHGGRRIELGEIEAAVDSIDELRASCCVHDKATDTIVLFYIGEMSENEIKGRLKTMIPPYMIPGRFVCMESLPVLPNGKMDRKTMTAMAEEECR